MDTVRDYFLVWQNHCGQWLQSRNYKMLALCKKSYDKPRQCIKKQGCHFADKTAYSQSYGFSSNHVQIWELDHREGWALKNWCFHTVVLEKTPESPLDCKEIKSVHPKGNQPWICIGRTDAEAPILWPSDAKSWLIGKTEGRRRWGQQSSLTACPHDLSAELQRQGFYHTLSSQG